ncbi:hypothetical protein BJX68DRAFT_263010 [Aspergillus pseudodeflectus]|uniref:Uncharacterized protein n=1 Tax=Aspergillus pseudodeflectus TaxID=176178 RepID=A0ABR4KYV8_9EURO
MGKESFKEKIRSLLHLSDKAAMPDTDSITPLFKKEPKRLKETPEVAPSPYNGDQCFSSCCRGKGYAR